MTDYSKQELRNSALESITVKDAGSDMAAVDTTMADDEIQALLEYLDDEDLIVFDTSEAITVENIPGRMYQALRDLAAEHLAPKFGVAARTVPGPGGRPESLYENAMRRLRRSVRDGDDDYPTRAQFF